MGTVVRRKLGDWFEEFCQGSEVVLLDIIIEIRVRVSFFTGIIAMHFDFGFVANSWLDCLASSASFGSANTSLGFGFFYHVC